MASSIKSAISARSAPRKLAEGFGRYKPRQVAHFTRIARASILETRNHVLEAVARNNFTEPDLVVLFHLIKRADIAALRLLRYLESCADDAHPGEGEPPDEPGKPCGTL